MSKKTTVTDTSETEVETVSEVEETEVEKAEVAEADAAEESQTESQGPSVEELIEENEKLKKTVARLQSSADKSDMYLNQLVAIKNDFENYKRRMRFNAEQAKQEGVQSVAMKLIEINDTFEIAVKHLTDDENLKAFEMIHQQFVQTLHGLGIEPMDVLGKEFDHMTMNALSQMDYGEENSGKVVEVYKNGYVMDGKVLRYAEVIVGA